MIKGAVIDETGKYRYQLWRVWDESKPKIVFIMLNGSTADANNDDPTLRRCMRFSQVWGFGSLEVVNLFGYRTTLPTELKKANDPIGPENDTYIIKAIKDAEMVIAAWGTNGTYKNQDKHVIKLLKDNGIKPYYIDLSKDGIPKHPLYLKSDLKPTKWAI